MIGKNVYTVRGKMGYLVVRKKSSLSVFILSNKPVCRKYGAYSIRGKKRHSQCQE